MRSVIFRFISSDLHALSIVRAVSIRAHSLVDSQLGDASSYLNVGTYAHRGTTWLVANRESSLYTEMARG